MNGDAEELHESLAAVLTEQKAHHDALQEGLNRIVARGAVERAIDAFDFPTRNP